MDFIKSQFDKLYLLVAFVLVIGVLVYRPGEFAQGLVSTVLGAMILIVTGRLTKPTNGNGNGGAK